jgi:hypothetical protein
MATQLPLRYDLRIHVRHPNWCFCTSCGEWFTSDSAFDAHLGPIPKVGRPKCKHPSKVRSGSHALVYDEARGAWHWDGKRPVERFGAVSEAA